MTGKEPMSADEVAGKLRRWAKLYEVTGNAGAYSQKLALEAALLLEQLSSLKEECARVLEPFAKAYKDAGPEGTPGYAGMEWRESMNYRTAPDHFRDASRLRDKLTNTPA